MLVAGSVIISRRDTAENEKELDTGRQEYRPIARRDEGLMTTTSREDSGEESEGRLRWRQD